MGGPSAAIVIEELIDLGARRLVRIGTCGALVDGLELGELVGGREVLAADGASAALGADGAAACPTRAAGRAGRRRRPAGHRGVAPTSSTTRARTRRRSGWPRAPRWWRWRRRRCCQSRGARGVAAGVLLAVSDVLGGGGARRMDRRRGARGRGRAPRRGRLRGAGAGATGLGDGEALLRPRHGLGAGRHGLAQRGEVAGDLVEPAPRGRPATRRRLGGAGRAAPRAGRARPRCPRAAGTPSAGGG